MSESNKGRKWLLLNLVPVTVLRVADRVNFSILKGVILLLEWIRGREDTKGVYLRDSPKITVRDLDEIEDDDLRERLRRLW
jgi:hypothetical protein